MFDRETAHEVMEIAVIEIMLTAPDLPMPDQVSMNSLVHLWAAQNRFDLSQGYIRNVVGVWERHCKDLHEIRVDELSQSDVDRVIEAYQGHSASCSTEFLGRALRMLFRWGVRHRFGVDNLPEICLPHYPRIYTRPCVADQFDRVEIQQTNIQIVPELKTPLALPSPRSTTIREDDELAGTKPFKFKGIMFPDRDDPFC